MLLDYSKCQRVDIPLGGAMDKFVIVNNYDNDSLCIVKPQNGESLAVISEYLASKLANALEIPCQKVDLGYHTNKLCCVIKFLTDIGEELHPYFEINDSSYSEIEENIANIPYTLNNIIDVITHYKDLNISVDERLKAFQRMCYFDTLIGNFDRHWGNWGFIGFPKNYRICPLYDNGSTLFPSRNKVGVENIITDKDEMNKRVYTFPKSAIRDESGDKTNYLDLVKELVKRFGEEELIKFCEKVNKIDFEEIIFCDDLENILTNTDKYFLALILERRYNCLLKEVIQ